MKDPNNINLPKRWYIARIKLINQKIKSLPNMTAGKHNGYSVIRYFHDGKKHEITEKSSLFTKYQENCRIQHLWKSELKQLTDEWNKYFNEPLELALSRYEIVPNHSSPMTFQSWKRLIDQECPEGKNAEYILNGINYRSRGEMQVAQAANELGLKYKYDCGIDLTDSYKNYLDFAFGFEEFNRWVAYEFLGMLDDEYYVRKAKTKYINYISKDMIPNRDVFTQGSSIKYMDNLDMVKKHLVYIVDKLCDLYVVEKKPEQ